jgi:DNA invertase Pin-like site-specific DNA recombinase
VRVVIYALVSTSNKSRDTENQFQQLRALAAQYGTIYKVYADQELAGKANRTGFKSLLREAAQKKFDLVVFWCLDRFSREGAAATLRYLTGLQDHGVHYKSLTEPCFDSLGPFGNISVVMLATIAAQDVISSNLKYHLLKSPFSKLSQRP